MILKSNVLGKDYAVEGLQHPRISADTLPPRNILLQLDRLHATEPESAKRVDKSLTGVIIRLCEGGDMYQDSILVIPATANKDAAWRKRMFENVLFAIVAVAKHLSSHFDGRDIKVNGKLVLPWKKPGQEVFEWCPEEVKYVDFNGAWKFLSE